MKTRRYTSMIGLLLSACWLTAGCSVIDEDLSDCNDAQQFQMDYQLKLVTNMTTELQTQLTTITEMSVAGVLETHLKDIFSDFAHDVDLSFYDTEGSLSRLEHVQDIINANQTTYDLTLPMRKYLHLAVANIKNNDVVSLADDGESYSATLRQETDLTSDGSALGVAAGILPSHTTGLFTARQPMEVLGNVNQTFNVRLFMANSAASLVIDPKGLNYSDLKVYATGFADAFLISDSTYIYSDTPPLIKAEEVQTTNELKCFCSVNFPSRDASRAASNTLWQFKVYLTKTDGSITETVMDIDKPLKAGDLKVIKGELDSDGAVRPYDSTVGVSVTLDWNNGSNYNPEL